METSETPFNNLKFLDISNHKYINMYIILIYSSCGRVVRDFENEAKTR